MYQYWKVLGVVKFLSCDAIPLNGCLSNLGSFLLELSDQEAVG